MADHEFQYCSASSDINIFGINSPVCLWMFLKNCVNIQPSSLLRIAHPTGIPSPNSSTLQLLSSKNHTCLCCV